MVKSLYLKTLKGLFTLFLLVLLISESNAQNEVAIGSATTKSNAILWLNGNGSQGLILPIVTSKTVVSAEKGMIVYDNSDNKVWYRNDNAWVEVGGATSTGDNGSLTLQVEGNQLKLQDGTTTLSTVNIAGGTPTNGAFMVWNGSSWQSTNLSDLNGTTGQVTGIKGKAVPNLPTTTQALVYDGSSWIFQPLTGGTDSQTLTFASPNLSISNGNSVDLSALDKDAQTLTLTGSNLSISGGNSVNLPSTGVTSVTAGTGLTGGTITTTGTLNVDVGTTANKVVQLDATGKLPAVDGSQLTNLPSLVEVGDISAVVAGSGLTGGGITGSVSLSLSNSGITPGIYGSATAVPQMTVDAFGRITAVTTFPPLVADGSVTGGTAGAGVKIAANTITDANILSLNASKITSGTLPVAQVPNLDASKITTGTFGTSQIPNLDASKITTGAFNTAQIPNLDASKITSGIIPTTQGGTGLNLASGSIANGQLLIGNNAGFAKGNLTAGSGISIANGAGSITISSTVTGTVTSVATGTGLTGGPITTSGTISLANTGVTAATYGTALTIPQIAVDQQGRITSANNQTIPTANTTTTGLLSNTDWTTFNSKGNGTVTNVTGTAPINVATGASTPVISITQANSTTSGFLTSADWNTFNSKGNGTVTNVTGTGPISVASGTTTPSISITQAGVSNNGFLSSADWNTFNSKQGAITLTTTGTSGAATFSGNVLNIPQYTSSSYLAGTGLTLSGNTFSVNASQNISTLSNLTSNGLIKTSGGTGALSIATPGTDYLVTETDPAVKAINGIVKSNGTTLSAALAGSDYVAPNSAITGATATKITYDAKGLVTAGTTLVAADIPNIAESQVTNLVTDLAAKQPQLNGTGFVKASGTTITYDNSTYLTSFTETDPAVKAINGIVKSNGTTLSAAVGGSDFVLPNAAITGATATKITYDSKGLVTSGAALADTDIPNLDATKITSGILPVTYGGTGRNTWSGLVYGSGATLSDIGDGTAGQFLKMVGTTPGWQTISIVDSDVSATAAIAGSKINPDFADQNITTTGSLKTGNNTTFGSAALTWPATNAAGTLTNDGTGALSWATPSIDWKLAGNAGTNPATDFIGTIDAQPLRFATGVGGIERMRIEANGSVGIGTNDPSTGNPYSNLVVQSGLTIDNGGANAGTYEYGLVFGNGNSGEVIASNRNAGPNQFGLDFYTGYSNRLAITSAGNVGIGTASPTAKLEVLTSGVGFRQTDGSVVMESQIVGTDAYFGAFSTGHNFHLVSGGADQMIIRADNNYVGIGRSPSTQKLEVEGGGLFNGNLEVTNQIKIAGGSPANGYVLTSDATGLATWQAPGSGSGWALTGNTAAASDYIGTNNSVPLNIKVNNQNAGKIEVDGTTNNVAFGALALNAVSTGSDNVAIGTRALLASTVSSNNVAVGRSALFTQGASNSFGSNTAIGSQALYQNTSGYRNTAIGYLAGATTSAPDVAGVGITTGNSNTFIGSGSGPTLATLSNSTAIGANAKVDANNKIRLGSTTVTVIEGQVSFSNTSDRRFKQNIKDIDYGLDFIKKLRPVSYNMKSLDNRLNWGFIAQDVEELVGTSNAVLTVGDDSLRTLSLRYTDFIAPMVKAMQEQQQEIEQLQAKLKQKNDELTSLENSVTAMKDELEEIKKILGVEAKAKSTDKKLK